MRVYACFSPLSVCVRACVRACARVCVSLSVCVVFPQRITNHLVEQDDTGCWAIGKRRYDTNFKDLNAFMEHFQSPVAGW